LITGDATRELLVLQSIKVMGLDSRLLEVYGTDLVKSSSANKIAWQGKRLGMWSKMLGRCICTSEGSVEN